MDSGGSPIVAIPRDLSFYGRSSSQMGLGQNKNTTSPEHGGSTDTSNNEEGASSGYPVYLTEDWDSGIGGGLWTTGLALGRYFAASQHFLEEFRLLRGRKEEKFQSSTKHQVPPVRVLELGSGNGFLGVCLVTAVAVAEANEYQNNPTDFTKAPKNWPGIEVVVTDTAEHLPLMRETIESNLKRILPQIRNQQQTQTTNNVANHQQESPTDDDTHCKQQEDPPSGLAIGKIARAEEYLWGEDFDFGDENDKPFDLIIGSDVAYRDHLHDPLISALDEFCVPQHTVALIGVTMNDTKPIFFEKLLQRGFRYEKLADHLLGDEFCTSSRQFGVFAISKC